MTADTSYDWIRSRLRELSAGTLSTADLARLQEIAQVDPFVADALEGFTAVPSTDHVAHLDQLHRRITQPKRARRRWLIPNLTVTAIAAVFMILVGTWAVVRWSGQPSEESRLVILSTDSLDLPGSDAATTPMMAAETSQDTISAGTSPAVTKKPEPPIAGMVTSKPAEDADRQTLAAPPASSSSLMQTKELYAYVEDSVTKEPVREGIRLFMLPTTLHYRLDEKGVVFVDVPTTKIARHLLVRYAEQGDRTYKTYPGNSMWPFKYSPEAHPREETPDYPLPAIPYPDFVDQLYRESTLTLEKDLKKSVHAVTITFTAGRDGQLSNLTATSDAPKMYADEAIRLLATGPAWTCPDASAPCKGIFTFFFKKLPKE